MGAKIFLFTPHPPLRVTLSLRERGLPETLPDFRDAQGVNTSQQIFPESLHFIAKHCLADVPGRGCFHCK